MKNILLIPAFLLFSISLFSQDSGFGLGVIVGEPTGLSAKMWTSERTAIDAGLAWSFIGAGYLHLHADVLAHSFALDVDRGQLPLYIGLGGKILMANNPEVGVRVPLGIAYLFDAAPLDIFLEIVPVLDLIPATIFNLQGGAGIRFYF